MQLIKTNQELIVGRRYLCRNKRPWENGQKAHTEIKTVGMEDGRRFLGSRIWAYDEIDQILSYDGRQRIATVQAVHGMDHNVAVYPKDYEINSQALAKWDIIGPIPELKEEVITALFDYPELLEHFNKPIIVHPDGNISIELIGSDNLKVLLYDAFVVDSIFGKEEPANTEEFVVVTEPSSTDQLYHTPTEVVTHLVGLSELPVFKHLDSIIGRLVVLTEEKYNRNGHFPEGMKVILDTISFSGYYAYDEVSKQILCLGWEGFKLID